MTEGPPPMMATAPIFVLGFALAPLAVTLPHMSHTTKAQSAALASVCRLVVAAERHGQDNIGLAELQLALERIDVDGLASPRPIAIVCNVGERVDLG